METEKTAGQSNQPGKSTASLDLKKNSRFLSLVIIYLANQVVLAVLLCAVAKPFGVGKFGNQWVGNALR